MWAAVRNPLPIRWGGVEIRRNRLPPTIDAGVTPIIVLRPTNGKDSSLSVKGDGLADIVTITPMPAALPEAERYLRSCDITQTPAPLPQLGKGQPTIWVCPPLQAGEYALRVSIKPTASGGFRVLNNLSAIWNSGSKTLSDAIIDINMPGSGLPNSFQSTGKTIKVASGDVVQIQLRIDGVAEQNNFPNTQYMDGVVLIPSLVDIHLSKIN